MLNPNGFNPKTASGSNGPSAEQSAQSPKQKAEAFEREFTDLKAKIAQYKSEIADTICPIFEVFQSIIDDTEINLANYKQEIERHPSPDDLQRESLKLKETVLKLNLFELQAWPAQFHQNIKKGNQRQADEAAQRQQLENRLKELSTKFRAAQAQLKTALQAQPQLQPQPQPQPQHQPQHQNPNASNSSFPKPELRDQKDSKEVEKELSLGELTLGITTIIGNAFLQSHLQNAQAANGVAVKPDFKHSLELLEISSQYCKTQKQLNWSNFKYGSYVPLLDRLKNKMTTGKLNDVNLLAFINTASSIEKFSRQHSQQPKGSASQP